MLHESPEDPIDEAICADVEYEMASLELLDSTKQVNATTAFCLDGGDILTTALQWKRACTTTICMQNVLGAIRDIQPPVRMIHTVVTVKLGIDVPVYRYSVSVLCWKCASLDMSMQAVCRPNK